MAAIDVTLDEFLFVFVLLLLRETRIGALVIFYTNYASPGSSPMALRPFVGETVIISSSGLKPCTLLAGIIGDIAGLRVWLNVYS